MRCDAGALLVFSGDAMDQPTPTSGVERADDRREGGVRGVGRWGSDPTAALQRQLDGLRNAESTTEKLAALGLMTASVAHELNNALTPISSLAELALAHPDDLDLRTQALRNAVDGVDRASQIINDVLSSAAVSGARALGAAGGVGDCGRAPAGSVSRPFDPDSEDVSRVLVPEVMNGAVGAVCGRDGLVTVSVDRGVREGVVLLGLGSLTLERLVRNLLANAVSACGGDGARVSLLVRRSTWNTVAASVAEALSRRVDVVGRGLMPAAEELEVLEVAVVDDGPGVAGEIVGTAFEPLVTRSHDPARPGPRRVGCGGDGGVQAGTAEGAEADGSRGDVRGMESPDRVPGTGLGLHICRDLAERAGGAVWLESRLGEGVTARVVLPAVFGVG